MTKKKQRAYSRAKPTGKFRSKFEATIAKDLNKKKVKYSYEGEKLEYVLIKQYLTDFILLDNGIIIEAKGVLTSADRQKMKAVKEQHPEADIRFLFQRASNKLNKKSKTTYSMWAEKHGFPWAEGKVPKEWITLENT